jgi:hypothetical protein
LPAFGRPAGTTVTDDAPNPAEAAGLPVQGPHRPLAGKADHTSALIPPRLVLKPGGAYVEFTRPKMLMGRHTDAEVRLALPDVSRRHCRMVFTLERGEEAQDDIRARHAHDRHGRALAVQQVGMG